MPSVIKIYGQNNYNLSLKIYGSLDKIVTLCKENGITDIGNETNETYEFEEKNIVNRKNTGYNYITKSSDSLNFIVTQNEIEITTQDNTNMIVQ